MTMSLLGVPTWLAGLANRGGGPVAPGAGTGHNPAQVGINPAVGIWVN